MQDDSHQRKREHERGRILGIAMEHYPELFISCAYDDITLTTSEDAGILMYGRTKEQYISQDWPKDTFPGDSATHVSCYTFLGEAVVLKHFGLSNATSRRHFIRTARIMQKIKHKYVATTRSCFEEGSDGYVEIPLYRGGNLIFFLQRKENQAKMIMMTPKKQNEGETKQKNNNSNNTACTGIVDVHDFNGMTIHVRALRQILIALVHIHGNQVVHGDLKLDNCLIDVFKSGDENVFNVKISDFDYSRSDEEVEELQQNNAIQHQHRLLQMDPTTRQGSGTFNYRAPEVAKNPRATYASDMYSFGCCILNVLMPLTVANQKIDPVTQVRVIPDVIKRHDPELYALLNKLLLKDPKQRSTASALLEDPFFNKDLHYKEDANQKVLLITKEKEKLARLRDCIVCYDQEDLLNGVECNNIDQKHFCCSNCLNKHVSNIVDPTKLSEFRKNNRDVLCAGHIIDDDNSCSEIYSDFAIIELCNFLGFKPQLMCSTKYHMNKNNAKTFSNQNKVKETFVQS